MGSPNKSPNSRSGSMSPSIRCSHTCAHSMLTRAGAAWASFRQPCGFRGESASDPGRHASTSEWPGRSASCGSSMPRSRPARRDGADRDAVAARAGERRVGGVVRRTRRRSAREPAGRFRGDAYRGCRARRLRGDAAGYRPDRLTSRTRRCDGQRRTGVPAAWPPHPRQRLRTRHHDDQGPTRTRPRRRGRLLARWNPGPASHGPHARLRLHTRGCRDQRIGSSTQHRNAAPISKSSIAGCIRQNPASIARAPRCGTARTWTCTMP